MEVGHKNRRWEVFISISASGPEFSEVLVANGPCIRPRMAADLKYTTSDVDFLYEHFTQPEPDSPSKDELHIRLVNPSVGEAIESFAQAKYWLRKRSNDPEWDGGGIHLNFAGHGSEGGGAIQLSDGQISPPEFIEQCNVIAEAVSYPGRLRVSAVLDSCHSGYWPIEILNDFFNHNNDLIIPFNVFASCMHDEYAYEDSSLAHGLYTYCFSTTPTELGSFGASGLQPGNSMGPSLSIAAGERGCSILSGGAQNPVAYWNGAGILSVSQAEPELNFESDRLTSRNAITSALENTRNSVRARLADIQSIRLGSVHSDHEMKKLIRAMQARLDKPPA